MEEVAIHFHFTNTDPIKTKYFQSLTGKIENPHLSFPLNEDILTAVKEKRSLQYHKLNKH